MTARTAIGLLVAVATTSCAWSEKDRYRARLEQTGKPAQHAVHGKRLRALMQDLEALLFERQRTQIEIDADRQRYFAQTVAVADGLLKSAAHIAQSADDMRAEDRAGFMALQTKLVSQTKALRALAKARRADAVAAQYGAITTTCNSCHSSFRDTSDPLAKLDGDSPSTADGVGRAHRPLQRPDPTHGVRGYQHRVLVSALRLPLPTGLNP